MLAIWLLSCAWGWATRVAVTLPLASYTWVSTSRFQSGSAGTLGVLLALAPVYRLMMRASPGCTSFNWALSTANRAEPSRCDEISSACNGMVAPFTLAMSPCVVCNQSPALKGWPKVTGTLAWACALGAATSTQGLAPSAQVNGALAIGVDAGGSIGPVMEGGKPLEGGATVEGGVGSSPPLLLPPPQPDKAARNNRPDNHLWCLLWRTCFRISVVFIGILGAQLAFQTWTGTRLGPVAMAEPWHQASMERFFGKRQTANVCRAMWARFKVVSIPRFSQLSEAGWLHAKLVVTALLRLFRPIQGPGQGPLSTGAVVEIVGHKIQSRYSVRGAAPL